MGLANPFMLVLSILIGLFILLYYFRKQYEQTVISSNLLWSEVMNEWEAAPWMDRMQRNLLFWLQLFILILLLLVLIRPFWYGEGIKGRELIFVVDPSASMNALNKGKSVFETQKSKMIEIVNQLDNQSVTIITANDQPNIVAKDESNRQKLINIINGLTISNEHENMEKALQMARTLATSKQSAIHVFTDGLIKENVSSIINDRYVEVHNNEDTLRNVTIKSFAVGPVDNEFGGVAVIQNQQESPQTVHFTIESEDSILFQKELTIKENGEEKITISNLPTMNYYQARISVEDDYKLDNASTVMNITNHPAVYSIGDVNPFVIKGFESIGVEVLQINEEEQVNIGKTSILLTEDIAKVENPHQPILLLTKENTIQVAEPIEQTTDTLLQYVEMDQVYIQGVSNRNIDGLETIVKSGENSLIQKGLVNGVPILAIHFPIEASDWPLHPNFPLFLYNSYQWLSQTTNNLGYFQPGEEKWINFGNSQDSIVIYTEQMEYIDTIEQSSSFKAPNNPGLYQAVSGENILYFSVLLDNREHVLPTEPSFALHHEILSENGSSQVVVKDNVWYWLTILTLLILIVEWEVFRRHAAI